MSAALTLAEAIARSVDDQPVAGPIALAGARVTLRAPGVIELRPVQRAPGAAASVISAGIHGDETAPIELLGRLAQRLDAGELGLAAPTLLIVGHPAAIAAGRRYVETNLNRLFRRDAARAGRASGEHRRAAALMDAVDAFWRTHAGALGPGVAGTPLHLDLHTAIRASRYPCFAVEPYARRPAPAGVWSALAAAGVQAALAQHAPSQTFSHYSRCFHDVVAFTLELGRVAAFGHNDVAALAPMQALLAARIAGRAPASAARDTIDFFQVAREVRRLGPDFELAFGDDTPNFTHFADGACIARDPGWGDTFAEGGAGVVVFPNAAVERGARALLLARPVAK